MREREVRKEAFWKREDEKRVERDFFFLRSFLPLTLCLFFPFFFKNHHRRNKQTNKNRPTDDDRTFQTSAQLAAKTAAAAAAARKLSSAPSSLSSSDSSGFGSQRFGLLPSPPPRAAFPASWGAFDDDDADRAYFAIGRA